MGRGRAKAKQTKVARELKYFTPDTDLRALERELHGPGSAGIPRDQGRQSSRESDESDDYEDRWASGDR